MAALMTGSTALHRPRPDSHGPAVAGTVRPAHLHLVQGPPNVDDSPQRRQPPYLWRRLAVLIAVSAVVIAVVGVAAPVLHADPVDPTAGARTHVVAQGDTLWSLATALEPSADPRAVVEEILGLNARAGVPVDPGGLQVGQRVLLPGD